MPAEGSENSPMRAPPVNTSNAPINDRNSAQCRMCLVRLLSICITHFFIIISVSPAFLIPFSGCSRLSDNPKGQTNLALFVSRPAAKKDKRGRGSRNAERRAGGRKRPEMHLRLFSAFIRMRVTHLATGSRPLLWSIHALAHTLFDLGRRGVGKCTIGFTGVPRIATLPPQTTNARDTDTRAALNVSRTTRRSYRRGLQPRTDTKHEQS